MLLLWSPITHFPVSSLSNSHYLDTPLELFLCATISPPTSTGSCLGLWLWSNLNHCWHEHWNNLNQCVYICYKSVRCVFVCLCVWPIYAELGGLGAGLEPGARAGSPGVVVVVVGWILYTHFCKVSTPVFSAGNTGRLPVVFTVGDARPQHEEWHTVQYVLSKARHTGCSQAVLSFQITAEIQLSF